MASTNNAIVSHDSVAPAPGENEGSILGSDEELAALLEPGEEESGDDEPFIEYKGEKFKVDPKVKSAWDDWQGEFTRKSMAVSEKEKTIADREVATRDAMAFQASVLDDVTKLKGIDQQLAEFAKITPEQWMQANQQDEKATSAARFRYQLLEGERAKLMFALQQKAQGYETQQKQTAAQRRETAERELRIKVKDWTPDKASEMKKFAQETYGFSAAELEGPIGAVLMYDPRVVQAMSDVMTVKQALARAKARSKAGSATQSTAPVVPIATPTRSRAAPTGAPRDADDIATWNKKFSQMMRGSKSGRRG